MLEGGGKGCMPGVERVWWTVSTCGPHVLPVVCAGLRGVLIDHRLRFSVMRCSF
jgi:hypothetical protein